MYIIPCPSCKQIVRIEKDGDYCTNCGNKINLKEVSKLTDKMRSNIYFGQDKIKTQSRQHANLKLFLTIIVILAIAMAFYIISVRGIKESTLKSKLHTNPETLFDIENVQFIAGEYGNYKVVGTVYNKSAKTFKFVSVKAEFYDKSGTISGDDFTYVCGNDYLGPYDRKSFSFLGDKQSNYHTVRTRIRDFTEVK